MFGNLPSNHESAGGVAVTGVTLHERIPTPLRGRWGKGLVTPPTKHIYSLEFWYQKGKWILGRQSSYGVCLCRPNAGSRGLEERSRCSSRTRAGKRQRLHIVEHSEAGEGVCCLWRPRHRRWGAGGGGCVWSREQDRSLWAAAMRKPSPRAWWPGPQMEGKEVQRSVLLFTHAWTLHMDGRAIPTWVFHASRDLSLLFIKARDFSPSGKSGLHETLHFALLLSNQPKSFLLTFNSAYL